MSELIKVRNQRNVVAYWDFSFLVSEILAKFQWGHPQRPRQIHVGLVKSATLDQSRVVRLWRRAAENLYPSAAMTLVDYDALANAESLFIVYNNIGRQN